MHTVNHDQEAQPAEEATEMLSGAKLLATSPSGHSEFLEILKTIDPSFAIPSDCRYQLVSGSADLVLTPSKPDILIVDPHRHSDKDAAMWGAPNGPASKFCSQEVFIEDAERKIDAELRVVDREGVLPSRGFVLSLRLRLNPELGKLYYQAGIGCTITCPGVKILAFDEHPPESPFAQSVDVTGEHSRKVEGSAGGESMGAHLGLVGSLSKSSGTKATVVDTMRTNIMNAGLRSLTTIREAIRSTVPRCGVFTFRHRAWRTLQGDFIVRLKLLVPEHTRILTFDYDYILCWYGFLQDKKIGFKGNSRMSTDVGAGEVVVVGDEDAPATHDT